METTHNILNARGALLTRPLPDGRVLDFTLLLFGRARLMLSRTMEDLGAEDVW